MYGSNSEREEAITDRKPFVEIGEGGKKVEEGSVIKENIGEDLGNQEKS